MTLLKTYNCTNPPTTHVLCMVNITTLSTRTTNPEEKNGAFKVSEKRRVILPSVRCLQNRHRWPTDRSGLNTAKRESLLHNYPLSWSLRYSQPQSFFFVPGSAFRGFYFTIMTTVSDEVEWVITTQVLKKLVVFFFLNRYRKHAGIKVASAQIKFSI